MTAGCIGGVVRGSEGRGCTTGSGCTAGLGAELYGLTVYGGSDADRSAVVSDSAISRAGSALTRWSRWAVSAAATAGQAPTPNRSPTGAVLVWLSPPAR